MSDLHNPQLAKSDMAGCCSSRGGFVRLLALRNTRLTHRGRDHDQIVRIHAYLRGCRVPRHPSQHGSQVGSSWRPSDAPESGKRIPPVQAKRPGKIAEEGSQAGEGEMMWIGPGRSLLDTRACRSRKKCGC